MKIKDEDLFTGLTYLLLVYGVVLFGLILFDVIVALLEMYKMVVTLFL